MSSADFPAAPELRELGRRLCDRLGVAVPEPISSSFLQSLPTLAERDAAKPRRTRALVLNLGVRATALCTAEDGLPEPIREARSLLDQYAGLLEENQRVVANLIEALGSTSSLLDSEATKHETELLNADAFRQG